MHLEQFYHFIAQVVDDLDGDAAALRLEEVESGTNNKRPQLAAAIPMAKSKRRVLVIAKLDRLTRNAGVPYPMCIP